MSVISPELAGKFFTAVPPGKPIYTYIHISLYLYICIYVGVQSPSHGQLFGTPQTAAHQASLPITISQFAQAYVH